MFYNELYDVLKRKFDARDTHPDFQELNLSLDTIRMNSDRSDLLFGSPSCACEIHDFQDHLGNGPASHDLANLERKDCDIACNKSFDYYIIKRADVLQADGAIIFFHGLNEKKWDKYLPWAFDFAQKTKKAVILFPIAFHMNRAEEEWSDRKKMLEVADLRRRMYKDNSESTFVNAAISSRLESHPQRVFWSGFQTYSDVVDMVKQIKNGNVSSISKDASFDLFGYSIGSFLSMILKMADPSSIFKDSKLFCFCGGMTIDRMFPISRYIMDSRSAIKMQTTFAELLSSNFVSDSRLAHFQNQFLHQEESWFKMMLRYNYFQKEREERIIELQHQIKVYVLEKDKVAPPIEALNTFQGGYRNIDVDVEIKDFDFDYSHVIPFPLTNKNKEEITAAFQHFTDSVSAFYMKTE